MCIRDRPVTLPAEYRYRPGSLHGTPAQWTPVFEPLHKPCSQIVPTLPTGCARRAKQPISNQIVSEQGNAGRRPRETAPVPQCRDMANRSPSIFPVPRHGWDPPDLAGQPANRLVGAMPQRVSAPRLGILATAATLAPDTLTFERQVAPALRKRNESPAATAYVAKARGRGAADRKRADQTNSTTRMPEVPRHEDDAGDACRRRL